MDIVNVVETLESHKLIRTNRVMGDWYSIFCPFHNNGQERKPSCGVSIHGTSLGGMSYKSGTFNCFVCGSRSLERGIDEILKSHGINKTAKEWLSENISDYEDNPDFEYLIPRDTMDALSNKYALEYIKEQENKVQTYISEEELASYRFTIPYMYERKMTDAVIELFDIGYDANWIPPGRKKPVPCITIPVRDREGRTLFFCRRSVKGKLYNYPEGVTKPVFGLDVLPKGVKTVVVCESAINAITATVYGYHAVALLGTGNRYQIQQLKEIGAQNFVICMDGDEAGRKATEKLKNALKSVAMVWAIHMPDGKDLNDCTKDEFEQLYARRD